MHRRSPLLLALLGLVVATAPGAALGRLPPPETQRSAPREKPEGEREKKSAPDPSPVFLRAASAPERAVDAVDGGTPPAATADTAPALRARRFRDAAPRSAAPRTNTRDVRAGLLNLPPPRV